jgi:phenylpropionate dioxygenase-like ring-hydroxylating dioxygenase large terminal subunit
VAAPDVLRAGKARSTGISYQDLLKTDTKPVPDVLREERPEYLGSERIPVERYISQEFHRLEAEKLWPRVWQMACREEDIPEVGDHVVYDVADQSIIVVRAAPDRIKAFHNACLHRGRQLREHDGHVADLRCPFHGFTWSLDGTLKHVPCKWDFPHVERNEFSLPETLVDTWGGFVFINMDLQAEPLGEFLGELPRHFERWPLENRYKEVHVAKILPCNWKVAQEAFMEAFHVVATHPQLLAGIGDANSQYDVYENFTRAITPNGTPSPHLRYEPNEQEIFDAMTDRRIDEPPVMEVPEGMTARQLAAFGGRARLQPVVPDAESLCDAEVLDSFYYTVFPNFHPWGAYNRIVYRFRPHGNDPDTCIMEVMYLSPFAEGERPPAAKIHWLGPDDDWTQAPELGFLARVFNQDTYNLPKVQRGLHAMATSGLTLSNYQETKIRHFHRLLERHLGC